MTVIELSLLGLIIAMMSSIAGYMLGQSNKVTEKTCIDRQGHIQELYCIKMNNISDSIDEIKSDIKWIKGEERRSWVRRDKENKS